MRQDEVHAYALIQAQIGKLLCYVHTYSHTAFGLPCTEPKFGAPSFIQRSCERVLPGIQLGLRPLKCIYELLRSQSSTNMLHEPLKVPTRLLRGFEPAQMGVQRVAHRRVEARVRASRTSTGQSHGSKETDGTMATERPRQERALKVPI